MKKKYLKLMCLTLAIIMVFVAIPVWAVGDQTLGDRTPNVDGFTPMSEQDRAIVEDLISELAFLKMDMYDLLQKIPEISAVDYVKGTRIQALTTDAAILAEYQNITDSKEARRAQLRALGAVPTSEMLGELKITDNSFISELVADVSNDIYDFAPFWMLIPDFAAFEAMFGNAWEMWGISTRVNTANGSFDTYEIVLQEWVLNRSIRNTGTPGNTNVNIYSNSNRFGLSMLQIGTELVVGSAVTAAGGAVGGPAGARAASILFPFLWNAVRNSIPIVNNAADLYYIQGRTVGTVRFVYVRPVGTTAWGGIRNALNVATARQTHTLQWAYIRNGQVRFDEDRWSFDRTIVPSDFSFRLTNAINAFRINSSTHSVITHYTIDFTHPLTGRFRTVTVPVFHTTNQNGLF